MYVSSEGRLTACVCFPYTGFLFGVLGRAPETFYCVALSFVGWREGCEGGVYVACACIVLEKTISCFSYISSPSCSMRSLLCLSSAWTCESMLSLVRMHFLCLFGSEVLLLF